MEAEGATASGWTVGSSSAVELYQSWALGDLTSPSDFGFFNFELGTNPLKGDHGVEISPPDRHTGDSLPGRPSGSLALDLLSLALGSRWPHHLSWGSHHFQLQLSTFSGAWCVTQEAALHVGWGWGVGRGGTGRGQPPSPRLPRRGPLPCRMLASPLSTLSTSLFFLFSPSIFVILSSISSFSPSSLPSAFCPSLRLSNHSSSPLLYPPLQLHKD